MTIIDLVVDCMRRHAALVTSGAATLRVSESPVVVPLLAMLFGVVSAVGGIMLASG